MNNSNISQSLLMNALCSIVVTRKWYSVHVYSAKKDRDNMTIAANNLIQLILVQDGINESQLMDKICYWEENYRTFWVPQCSNIQSEYLCTFVSFDQWVNKASSWISKTNRNDSIICIDARGRNLVIGGDFMKARDEGTFPVMVYRLIRPEIE